MLERVCDLELWIRREDVGYIKAHHKQTRDPGGSLRSTYYLGIYTRQGEEIDYSPPYDSSETRDTKISQIVKWINEPDMQREAYLREATATASRGPLAGYTE